MKIILNQDVVNLGEEGDVVVVKDGYARNYLLPTGAAVLYSKANAAIFASRAAQIEKRKAEKRAESASLKEKLDSAVVTLVVTAGESGKLFGSVTAVMVQDALAKQGITVERKKIEVPTHAIKMVGTYSIVVHLYESEVSHVKLVIESEAQVKERAAEEAKKAAEAAKKAKVDEDEAMVELEKALDVEKKAEKAEGAVAAADDAEAAVDLELAKDDLKQAEVDDATKVTKEDEDEAMVEAEKAISEEKKAEGEKGAAAVAEEAEAAVDMELAKDDVRKSEADAQN